MLTSHKLQYLQKLIRGTACPYFFNEDLFLVNCDQVIVKIN